MPAADFLNLLRAHRLMEPERLDHVARFSSKFSDPRALAKDLIQRGWLTAFQVNKLLQGKGQDLVLGQYILIERLGQGGMGEVFKARHSSLDRIVALKIIRRDLTAKAEAVRRFHREIQSVAKLSHPNIVMAFDANQVGEIHYLAMEFVEGTDLGRLVKAKGPMKVREACDAIRQGALGLQHAFERGLVHRDIKPTNLLRAAQGGVVKLLDMGLARLQEAEEDSNMNGLADHAASMQTQAGRILGTPDYIAPEQARNSHTVDIRADLYSLGCTFYYVLLGWPPFPGGASIEKLVRHQTETPKAVEQIRPEVPAVVGGIIRKLLAKRPEERYQSPGEVAAALATVSGLPRATPVFPGGARETFVASRALIAQMLAEAQTRQAHNLPTAKTSGAPPVATAVPVSRQPTAAPPAAASPWDAAALAADLAPPRARWSERWPWWALAVLGSGLLIFSLVLLIKGKPARTGAGEPTRPAPTRPAGTPRSGLPATQTIALLGTAAPARLEASE
jgi:serine/threonine-protein kinase